MYEDRIKTDCGGQPCIAIASRQAHLDFLLGLTVRGTLYSVEQRLIICVRINPDLASLPTTRTQFSSNLVLDKTNSVICLRRTEGSRTQATRRVCGTPRTALKTLHRASTDTLFNCYRHRTSARHRPLSWLYDRHGLFEFTCTSLHAMNHHNNPHEHLHHQPADKVRM